MSIHLHRGDLPPEINFSGVVAIDTETMGLNPHRDRLCLVQLSAGDGVCHLVQFATDVGSTIVAECVEDQDVLLRLKAMGVAYAQGFGIYQPHPIDSLAVA